MRILDHDLQCESDIDSLPRLTRKTNTQQTGPADHISKEGLMGVGLRLFVGLFVRWT